MTVQTIAVAPGTQLNIEAFTPEETKRFQSDYATMGNIFSRNFGNTGHAIRDLLDKYRDQMFLFAQAAKNDLEGGGVYQGINAMNGFGMGDIRPDFLCPTEQDRTFEVTLAALTASDWYGYLHHAAIGGAYNASPLYLRKEVAVAICGFIELANPFADEMMWEINGKQLPVWNMETPMKAGEPRIFECPQVMYLAPRKQYRSRFRTNTAAGNMCLRPIGVAFPTADYMRTTEPTLPDSTAP